MRSKAEFRKAEFMKRAVPCFRGRSVCREQLTNYDLLLSPHGTGKDYRECFESFIADCDDYIRKVTAIRDEARMHMEKLLKAAEEIQ